MNDNDKKIGIAIFIITTIAFILLLGLYAVVAEFILAQIGLVKL